MKKIILFAAMPIMALSLLTFTSCEKLVDDASETADSAEDFSDDQKAISDLVTVIQDMATTELYMMKKANGLLPPGAVSYSDSSFTDGDGVDAMISLPNMVFNDGTYRTLDLYVSLTKPFSEVGSMVSVFGVFLYGSEDPAMNNQARLGIEIQDYAPLTITRTADNKVEIVYEALIYYSVNDFKNKVFTGDSYLTTGNFVLTQTEGLQTPGMDGDKFVMTGNSTGENHNGTAYTTTITKDLVYVVDNTCSKTFTEGQMTLKNDGATTELKLDFGSGACDNDVQITLPGGLKKTYTVK